MKVNELNNYKVIYWREQNDKIDYLDIMQRYISDKAKIVYGSNVNISYTEIIVINGNNVKFVNEGEHINFILVYENYIIEGETNLTKDELINILNNLKI